MQYEWYIDVFFLVNLGMDVLLLKMLGMVLKVPVSWPRLLAGGVLGAVGSCLAVIFWYLPMAAVWAIGGILPGIAMIWVVFRPKSFRVFVKMLLLFLMETFCIGGMMEAVYEHTRAGYFLAWILQGRIGEGMPILAGGFLAAGAWFGFRFLWLNVLELKKERQIMYLVTLVTENTQVTVTGYLDTGNCLREPKDGCPVHIVSEKLWKELWEPGVNTKQIPFHTVGNPLGVMEGMQLQRMEIREETGEKRLLSEPWIARAPFQLTRDGSYDVLLHKETFKVTVQ